MTARYPHGYDRADHATSAGRLDGAAARHLGRQPGRAPAGVAAPSRPSGAARGGLWSPWLRSHADSGDLRHSRRSRPGGALRDWRGQGRTAGKIHAPGSARIAAAPDTGAGRCRTPLRPPVRRVPGPGIGGSSMGGFSQPGLADLRLWGNLGKVPVAIVAGTAVSWLSIHFEAAVEELMDPGGGHPAVAAGGPGAAEGSDATRRADAADPGALRRVFRAMTARENAAEPARRLSAVLTARVDWRPAGPHSLRASNFTPWVGGFGGGQ